jgi:hypothetical protein
MPNSSGLSGDLLGPAAAISAAIAGEDFQRAAHLLTHMLEIFNMYRRNAAETEQYTRWLVEQHAAAKRLREHVAVRLAAVNASRYGRAASEATWSFSA